MALVDMNSTAAGDEAPPLTTLHGSLADRLEAIYLDRRARDSQRHRTRVEVSQAPAELATEGPTARIARETEAELSQTRKRYRREVDLAHAELYEPPTRRRYRRTK